MPPRDNLALYRQKRDFTKTPEPEGIPHTKEGKRYLIQKHAATRLHYDFRLELDGVLKSWAVTRGPSLDPHDKRLAVEVEDHPVAYGSFEGTIPKGQYGGGTVMLWDEGTWEAVGDPHKGLEKGKLEFRLHGKRLKGEWTLVRMRPRESKGLKKQKERHNWLLIKRTDEYARIGDHDRLLAKYKTSVVSGRTMEKIAQAKDRVWQSKPRGKAANENIRQSILPGFIQPQLATLTDVVPKGREWVHEIKFDGYRTLAYIEDGSVRMLTRNQQDWTHKFTAVTAALRQLEVKTAVVDGEIIALDENGISSFRELQDSLSRGESERLQYYAFDLLHLNGEDLRGLTLLERKAKLKPLIGKGVGGRVFYSEHFPAADGDFLARLCRLQMEGAVSKRTDAPYTSGRSRTWVKTKCHRRQEFVIGGFTPPTHKDRGIGALLLGYYEERKLVYAGKVGTGFNREISRQLRKKLDELKQEKSAFSSVPAAGGRNARWVKPWLVCEVEFTEWTGDGRLRHPSYQGLREDKPAKDVHRDQVKVVKNQDSKMAERKTAIKRSTLKAGVEVEGIVITHPDRVIYEDADITKAELAEYYQQIAKHILPHVAGRPLSMVRCPEGTDKPCFFQRHIAKGQSPNLHDTNVMINGRNESYLMIKDIRGLITLVQWGVIELHPWGCLADKPDRPDRIIFDLDPAPEVPWKHMVDGAKEVRQRMKELGLESFIKTTGGKGLHVTIPITRGYGWKTVKAFARAVAESMQHDNPARYIATASKAARKGKIFVDYLRNDHTATAVAPFSARAREGAPVATPLAWDELKLSLKPSKHTVETIPLRLKRLRNDPWAEFFKVRQKIASSYLRALKIEPE